MLLPHLACFTIPVECIHVYRMFHTYHMYFWYTYLRFHLEGVPFTPPRPVFEGTPLSIRNPRYLISAYITHLLHPICEIHCTDIYGCIFTPDAQDACKLFPATLTSLCRWGECLGIWHPHYFISTYIAYIEHVCGRAHRALLIEPIFIVHVYDFYT